MRGALTFALPPSIMYKLKKLRAYYLKLGPPWKKIPTSPLVLVYDEMIG